MLNPIIETKHTISKDKYISQAHILTTQPTPQQETPTPTTMEEDFDNDFTTMSVGKWVQTFQSISEREEEEEGKQTHPTFQAIEWALTGRDTVGQKCAKIDAVFNRPRLQSASPYLRRDYDSVLGFTENIFARGAILIYIKPSPIRPITRRLKLRTTFIIDGEVSQHFTALYISHCVTCTQTPLCNLLGNSLNF
jgi:hypothetical protein